MYCKQIVYSLFLLLISSSLYAFQEVKKDTSYTINSAYLKYVKKFPKIEIVYPKRFVNVSETKNIIYKELKYRNLYLDAFINTSDINPAVILIHGGGWKSGNKSHLKPLAQFIATKGYSCFTVEYRLSDEAKYPEGIYDIKQAIRFVKNNASQFKIDTTKIAILGASSGAQMASLIGAASQNDFVENANYNKVSTSVKAIINLDGILAFKHPKSKEGKMASLWLGGNYQEAPNIWIEASALTYVNKNTPPTLFINSQYDRFHAGRDDMIKILNKHKIYNQVKTFPNSPHTFWLFHPYFNKTVNYITKFLDKTLKNK